MSDSQVVDAAENNVPVEIRYRYRPEVKIRWWAFSRVEAMLRHDGYWCCYSGPLVLRRDITDYLVAFGSNYLKLRALEVLGSTKEGKSYLVRCNVKKYHQPVADTDSDRWYSDNEYHAALDAGEAANYYFDQVITIYDGQVRIWAPAEMKALMPAPAVDKAA